MSKVRTVAQTAELLKKWLELNRCVCWIESGEQFGIEVHFTHPATKGNTAYIHLSSTRIAAGNYDTQTDELYSDREFDSLHDVIGVTADVLGIPTLLTFIPSEAGSKIQPTEMERA